MQPHPLAVQRPHALRAVLAGCFLAGLLVAQDQEPPDPATAEGAPPTTQRDTDDADDADDDTDDTPQEPAQLPRMTITAFRTPQDPFEIPRSVTIATAEDLQRRTPGSVLDTLDQSIGIWVEKRTATTSDPVVRGLSGANLLALVDGDPLTTFWGEGGFAGDDMYGKVEAESVSRIEVIRGPGSVQYGSNALGGVIQFITRKIGIDFADEDGGVVYGGRAKTAFELVNTGFMGRLDVEAATTDFRFRVGGTYRDLDDGQGGDGVGTLSPSGGEDRNFDLAAEYRLDDDGQALLATLQRVDRADIKRFYRPAESNENERLGTSLRWRSTWDTAPTNHEGKVYYQHKRDDRKFFDTGEYGVAEWRTYSADWVSRSREILADHQFVAGVTLRRDEGESPDDEEFTITVPDGTTTKAAPDQNWHNIGAFLMDDWELTSWLTLQGSLRYDFFDYESRPDSRYRPLVGDPALDRRDENEQSWTGGLGAVVKPHDDWRVAASWTRGFRFFAPRFGIVKTGFGVVAPSGLLDPVTADNYELALRHRSEFVQTQLVGYYTDFRDFQETQPGTFMGADFFDYNGDGVLAPDERVYVTQGGADAYVYGVEWEARWEVGAMLGALPDGCYLGGGFMWNRGQNQAADEPLRHTHPARGILRVGYEEPFERRYYVELQADFVDDFTRIPSDRLSGDVGFRRDPQDPNSPLVRSDGLPGYSVFDLYAGYRFSDDLRLGVKVENIGNENYRPAHSRMDAFGFNVGVWVEATF